MKFACRCGATIGDAGDGLPGKAWLLADQDAARLGEEGGDAEAMRAAMRPVYQCRACGRLALRDPVTGATVWYAVEEDGRRRVLGSSAGNAHAHAVALVGGWQDWRIPPGGDLHWGESGDRPGGFETFAAWPDLERRYHQVLADLRAEGRLARAWLHRGSATVHAWPPGSASTAPG